MMKSNEFAVFDPTSEQNDSKRNDSFADEGDAVDHEDFASLTDRRFEYPVLAQRETALFNVDSNELIRIQVSDLADVVTPSGNQLYFQEKYEEGGLSDATAVIENAMYVTHTIEAPQANEHAELRVPGDRPDPTQFSYHTAPDLSKHILGALDDTPLILLSRPAVDYSEVGAGETYDIEGWFRPRAERGSRVQDIDAMCEHYGFDPQELTFPLETNVESETGLTVPGWDVHIDSTDKREVALRGLTFRPQEDGTVDITLGEGGVFCLDTLRSNPSSDYNDQRVRLTFENSDDVRAHLKRVPYRVALRKWDTAFDGAWDISADGMLETLDYLTSRLGNEHVDADFEPDYEGETGPWSVTLKGQALHRVLAEHEHHTRTLVHPEADDPSGSLFPNGRAGAGQLFETVTTSSSEGASDTHIQAFAGERDTLTVRHLQATVSDVPMTAVGELDAPADLGAKWTPTQEESQSFLSQADAGVLFEATRKDGEETVGIAAVTPGDELADDETFGPEFVVVAGDTPMTARPVVQVADEALAVQTAVTHLIGFTPETNEA